MKLVVRVRDKQVSFNKFKAMILPDEGDACFSIDSITCHTKDIADKMCSS